MDSRAALGVRWTDVAIGRGVAGEGKIKNVRFSLRWLCAAFPEQREQEQWGQNEFNFRYIEFEIHMRSPSGNIQQAEDERELAGKGEL